MDQLFTTESFLRLETGADGLRVVFARDDGEDGEHAVAVRPVWARPISGEGREVSLIDERRRDVLLIDDVDALDRPSRAALEDALAARYLVPTVRRILATQAHLGVRFWTVETDRGVHRFAMREPTRNVTWLDERRAVLRDVLGNRYRIADFAALDEASRAAAAKVL
ncbi:MAG TPA: DUF1854 domain-containing protein [Planctomycetota bacterium]|nr:DUF1854 domain-containing protein [Planctomycetota bacterium]